MSEAAAAVVETKRVVRNLPVRLKDGELLEFGRRLAQSSSDIHAEEERQTQVKTELKAKLGAIENERTRLAGIVSSGRENRDVPCDMIYDYSRLIVQVVRTDTNEVIETRRMTESEQQRGLFEEEQAGGQEASPEQVEAIRKHLQEGRSDERVASILAAIAQSDNWFLTKLDVERVTPEEWAELVEVGEGGGRRALWDTLINRAHVAAERDGAEQHCRDCGARLDFLAAGQVEGFPEDAYVGLGCDRAVGNGPMA